ncbi:hypothetical protein [Mucilaginibacter paludis]|uniref:RiboL-PSP-HEPN domain-containing protein n=1 Tax=Mucilaginibacter paludis DSM 18603 TaxID=714943 RepID=H1YH97_9SPHI|nr:hypothetical protein [Mucilaginibacter paludis]EHQ24599.1 hypothetical protein Mucpa_0405 [Mucilaginibacter paludis DSM 18603]
MWLQNLEPGESWMGVWKGKFLCFDCGAIIEQNPCDICGYLHTPFVIPGLQNNEQPKALTFKGAIHENTYITLGLLKREWERPLIPESDVTDLLGQKIPQRIAFVLLFWTLFESLMDRMFSKKLESIPPKIAKNLLKKNNNISARMGEFYQLVFDTSFKDDLIQIGSPLIYDHLKNLQERRNAFIHDNPIAINEQLISDTLIHLQDIQAAWIKLYNKRCTVKSNTNL